MDLESRDFVSSASGGLWAAYSPCGTRVSIGSRDGTVSVLDVNSGEVIYGPLEGYSHTVWSVGFSPHGKYIVSGSADRTIRIWDDLQLPYGRHVDHKEAAGHTKEVTSVVFSPSTRQSSFRMLRQEKLSWILFAATPRVSIV